MYSIKVKTPLKDNTFVLESLSTFESLSRIPTYQITLLSKESTINPDDILAQPIVISTAFEKQEKRVIYAYVTEFSCSPSDSTNSWTRYQVTAYPWLWFLGLNSDCRVFQDKTVVEIIQHILKEPQYKNFAMLDKTKQKLRTWKYSVQYRETDFNFIARLLEQEGIYFYFEHTEQGATLVLENNSIEPAKKLIDSLNYVFNPEKKEDRFTVSALGFVKKVQSTKYVLADYDDQKAEVLLADHHLGNNNIKMADAEIYDYPGEFDAAQEAQEYVDIRAEELAVAGSFYSMSCNNTSLMVGMEVKVKSPLWKNQLKRFFITEVASNFHQNAREAGSGGETSFSVSFKAIESSKRFRPARITPLPIAQGLQTAVVTGSQGQEVYTNSELQVRVKFHWDRFGKKDDTSSCWLRVSQLWAGKKRGFLAVPRVGDEVIVAFEHGDPDRPIVIGSVYNGVNKGRHSLTTEETRTGLVTLSSKQGGESYNELMIDDKKGEELVFIRAQKNLRFLVNNDVQTLVNHNVAEKIKNDVLTDIGHDYVLKVASNHTEKVGQNLTLEVGAAEQVKVGTDLTIKAGQNVTIQAGTKITLKAGSSTIELGPEGVTIKGSIVKIN